VPRIERFMAKVVKQDDGCWLWTGAKSKNGYGIAWDGTRTLVAHRFAYRHFVGAIPEGLDLDHLCRNRACVNPTHLEPVTRRVNALRGVAPTVLLHKAGMCKRGHLMTPENTYYWRGKPKSCRICTKANSKRSSEERKRRRVS
jgi:hypothetical protein